MYTNWTRSQRRMHAQLQALDLGGFQLSRINEAQT